MHHRAPRPGTASGVPPPSPPFQPSSQAATTMNNGSSSGSHRGGRATMTTANNFLRTHLTTRRNAGGAGSSTADTGGAEAAVSSSSVAAMAEEEEEQRLRQWLEAEEEEEQSEIVVRDQNGDIDLEESPVVSFDEVDEMVLEARHETELERQRLADAVQQYRINHTTVPDQSQELLEAVRASLRAKVDALTEDSWMFEPEEQPRG